MRTANFESVNCENLLYICIYIYALIPDPDHTKYAKKTVEKLLLLNGCIKNKSLFHIYKISGRKLCQILEGVMDQYPLLLLALLVSVTEDEFLSKLKDPLQVKDIENMLISGLITESQLLDEAMIKEVISNARTHLEMMNQIFPSDVLEVKIKVINELYLNTKEEFTSWILQKLEVVENVNTVIRPNNIDEFIQMCTSCSRSYEGNKVMWQYTTNWLGSVMVNRSMKILGMILPNSTVTDIKSTLGLSNTLILAKIISIFSLEDQIREFCGTVFTLTILYI